jgi:hypothetical protein
MFLTERTLLCSLRFCDWATVYYTKQSLCNSTAVILDIYELEHINSLIISNIYNDAVNNSDYISSNNLTVKVKR